MSSLYLLGKLELLRAQAPELPGLLYRMAPDFVLRHGVSYLPRRFPNHIPQGAPLQCFGNSITLAVASGLKYVEGFALSPFGEVIHHAWNANCDNRLVDSTWMNTGMAYLGVEFSAERADDATWNGDASILDDFKRGWPIFRQPWRGEVGQYWPPNPRLSLLRQGRVSEALAWMRSNR